MKRENVGIIVLVVGIIMALAAVTADLTGLGVALNQFASGATKYYYQTSQSQPRRGGTVPLLGSMLRRLRGF